MFLCETFEGEDRLYEIYQSVKEAVEGNGSSVTEDAKEALEIKAKDFIEDANKFIMEQRKKSLEKIDKAKVSAYIGLGLYIVSGILGMTIAGSLIGLILSVLTLITALISLLISIGYSISANKQIAILKNYKTKLIRLRSSDKKVNKKIQHIIHIIDAELDSLMVV